MDLLLFYLVGCFAVIVLTLLKVCLFWSVGWLTGENTMVKNIKKLQPPDKTSTSLKLLKYAGIVLFEALFSWISVLGILFQIFVMPLKVLRSFMAIKPDKVKALRFPLWHNPDLSRESIWAHFVALQVEAEGERKSARTLIESLEEIKDYHPRFMPREAVNDLKELGVCSEAVITEVVEVLDLWAGENDRDS